MDGLSRFHEQDQSDEGYLERWLQFYEEEWPLIWACQPETVNTIPEPLGSKSGTMPGLRWYTLPEQVA